MVPLGKQELYDNPFMWLGFWGWGAIPVKRGLVTDPGNYRWSSHNWYLGWRDVPLTIDGMEQ